MKNIEQISKMHEARERKYGEATLDTHVMHHHIALLLELIAELKAENKWQRARNRNNLFFEKR